MVSLDNSLELKWKPGDWTPDDDCTKGMKKKPLSTINFPGEPFKSIETTRDTEEKLMKKVERVLDKVLTKEEKQLDLDHFIAELVRDEILLPDLQEWTDECTERVREMFDTIDMDDNDIVDKRDVGLVTKESLGRFLGRMQDRFADITDILFDQKIDFHIAKEYPKSRNSIVNQLLKPRSKAKDEL